MENTNSEHQNEFPVMQITNSECLNEIREYTGNFSKIGNVDDLFIDSLKVKLADDDGAVYKGTIDAPEDVVVTKKVIGRGGYYFRLTTDKTGAYFIWHDRTANKFVFWGEEYNIKQAMGVIGYWIKIVTQREQNPQFYY